MKKALILTVISFAIGLASCKKTNEFIKGCTFPSATNYNPKATDNDGSCTFENSGFDRETAASAKSEHDNSSGGVYKGTFVGSSGYFKLTLLNDTIFGQLRFEGNYYELISNLTPQDISTTISNGVFYSEDGVVTVNFSCNSNGTNPEVQLNIQGHSGLSGIVVKELSTNHAKVYEGSAITDQPMTFNQWTVNLIITENDTIAYSSIIYPNGTKESAEYSCFISNNTMSIYRWAEDVPGQWYQEQWVRDFGQGTTIYINDDEIYGQNQSDQILLTRSS